ncbi:MAG: GNAT family N-acetyltransferase [Pirellulaceae bacterium]|jgi:RimJ/RimL family protein N-acetyltransferase|nr:GNAT family N-acetyltransferase [Pirellulaceae bacterium]
MKPIQSQTQAIVDGSAPAPTAASDDWLTPVTLSGQHATLQPLTEAHAAALAEAAVDGELWKLWYTSVPAPADMSAEVQRRLRLQSQGSMLPFAVLDDQHIPVGMTTFMNVDPANCRVEIGSTWYAQRVHRTALNTQCKLLLMQHAFETLDCIAVEFRTSFLNRASRRAIERLGAKLDGVLRNHQHHRDGSLRDTCCYSVIASEWPAVKAHLEFCLVQ